MASTWSRTDSVPRARKLLAGGLIRLAHRIYPPKVTEHRSVNFTMTVDPDALERFRKRQEQLLSAPHMSWY